MIRSSILILTCLSALATGTARAAESAPPAPEEAAPAKPALSAAKPQSDDTLAALSGGTAVNTSVALTEQDLTAVNTGNTISAGVVTTGAITVRDNAFSGFNGVGNVIMNTGNNNNLQSSMSVTVIITP